MITVVRIIDRLNIGGPALHAVLASAKLDPTRFRTLLLYGTIEQGEGDMSYLLGQYGIRGILVPGLSRDLRLVSDLRALIFICRILLKERPQIVHTHKTKAGLLGRLAAMVCAVPVRIHTYHGHVLEGYFGKLQTQAMLAMERALGLLSTRVVTISEKLKEQLGRELAVVSPDRLSVVPLGLDLAPFLAADGLKGQFRAELGLDNRAFLIGMVGRMVPIKDHSSFLQALAHLKSTRPDLYDRVYVVLVGGGECQEAIAQAIADLGLPRVKMLGWRSDLPRIYADLDLVVLTSKNEGTPVAIIESLAAGVRVLATDVGGVKDVVQNHNLGTLCPRGDVAQIASGLAEAIKRAGDGQDTRLSREDRLGVQARYGIERLVLDLAALYKEEVWRSGAKGVVSRARRIVRYNQLHEPIR